jgi:hypothetical protein
VNLLQSVLKLEQNLKATGQTLQRFEAKCQAMEQMLREWKQRKTKKSA